MAAADENGQPVPDTFESEARRTYRDLANVLNAAGLGFANVVQIRCYQNKQDWDAHNRIYRESFTQPYRARSAGDQPSTQEK